MNKEVLCFVFLCCQLQQVFNDGVQGCKQRSNCHECITDSAMCAWCSAPYVKLSDRCQPENSTEAALCPPEYSQRPKSTVGVDAHDNLDFTSDNQHAIQIKPQKIKIKLRVGEKKDFHFYYKAAKDYPVDLYFLLDASNSMKKIRNSISQKSKEIYDAMHNLTTNIKLGYGTFIDKNVFPFQNSNRKKCYAFKHNLNLTSELNVFQNYLLVNKTFGANYDDPESGLDGLAQVMACKERIKFRDQSRRVIILITDNHSHHAGDGHVAGIIKPYDGECHLDEEGYYTKEKEMDYPSIGMINKLAAKDQFTIIFVVSKEFASYQVLADAIPGAYVSTYDGSTISEQLKKFYKHISNNIHLDVNMLAEDKDKFEITFDPDCRKKNNCKVVLGEQLRINGQIKLKEYYKKDNITVPILQKGLNEALNLEIDIISKCSCEFKNDSIYQFNSSFCNNAGDLQCAVCSCYTGRSGPTCACIENNSTSAAAENSTHCFDEDGVECNNNGNCICGGCLCRPGFAGPYCEVRTDNCPRDNTGELCSGHGRCWNGTCQCFKDSWEGDRCECSKARDLCMDAKGKECNNLGKCKCQQCECEPLPKWDVRDYKGKHCQLWCDDCHTRQCLALIDCVACHNQKNSTEYCRDECGDKLAILTDEADQGNANVCVNARVSFGCYENFSYVYKNEEGIILYRVSEPNCNEEYYKYGGIALLSALLVGLVTMAVVKLVTDAHDRAEYERFLQTPDDDEAVENFVYKKPTNMFRNPNFKRSFTFR